MGLKPSPNRREDALKNALPHKAIPFGDRVKAFLGFDSGHWDVPDITAVAANAYRMVERGILSQEDLRYYLSTGIIKPASTTVKHLIQMSDG